VSISCLKIGQKTTDQLSCKKSGIQCLSSEMLRVVTGLFSRLQPWS